MSMHDKTRKSKSIRTLYFALLLFCILPITTLFQSYAIFNSINKILVLLVFACLFISFFKTEFHPVYWLALLALVGLTVYDYSISSGNYATLNDPVYLPFWFLLMMIFTGNAKEVRRFFNDYISTLKWIIGIWILIVGVSIFLPSSYDSGWGDETYFGSIPHSIFRLAPCACLIQVFLLIALSFDRKNRYIYLFCQLVPLYCGFMGGSRTYFAIIILYFLLFLRFYTNTKKEFYLYILIFLCVGVAVFGISGIGSKVAATQYTVGSYFDFLGTITNGRSYIWTTDLDYYFNADLLSIVFGSGYDKIYELSFISRLGDAVYAHNDFINVLVVNGVTGFLLYTLPVVALLKSFRNKDGASWSLIVTVSAIWLINAIFNMNYTYTCAAIALGLLPTAIAFAMATYPSSSQDSFCKSVSSKEYKKEVRLN